MPLSCRKVSDGMYVYGCKVLAIQSSLIIKGVVGGHLNCSAIWKNNVCFSRSLCVRGTHEPATGKILGINDLQHAFYAVQEIIHYCCCCEEPSKNAPHSAHYHRKYLLAISCTPWFTSMLLALRYVSWGINTTS